MEKFSYLRSGNAGYIDEIFLRYSENPESIDPTWRYFFDGLELGAATTPAPSPDAEIYLSSEAKVAGLITAYRDFGHCLANINPLHDPPPAHPLLELSQFGLTKQDLTRTFTAGRLIGLGPATLDEIIARLRETYCSSIGVEFTHIQNPEEHGWLQRRMEAARNSEDITPEARHFILRRLSESETFERFLHTRYVAQKRFSIEGAESLIPALDRIIEVGSELGAREFVIGMAHRGRLNVLTNIFEKKPEFIFTEFEGAYKADTSLGEGDVKYHMGYSADIKTSNGRDVHLSLGSNPSHLEFINPVIEGVARAKQSYLGDSERKLVIPIQIHGDAAFAGQGVCYETLNLSQLDGFSTGGTIHFVINNQVGFTTDPKDSRSTIYSTDLGKMLEVPIFHVNSDDPEAVWYVARLCMEYRQTFGKDVFIDLICYRKHGHNEGDEPSFTQPTLYKRIKAHPSTREIYAQKLNAAGILHANAAEKIVEEVTAKLTDAQARTKAEAPRPIVSVFEGKWRGLRRAGNDADIFAPIETAVPADKLVEYARKLNRAPDGFNVHPKLTRFLELRLKAIEDGNGIDWGNSETLAYASLLDEGYPIRLTGQDAERGTFSHRHSVLNDAETGAKYAPLRNIREGQAEFSVYNSHLSETAVLGFEHGHSLADPNTLVLWEAQFGDFANGAQVIIDQFIASSESKWQRMSGLVLLLPHGYEGQGPEHSSARIERFLNLCGKYNMVVCNLTTPAQIFHALRRQVKREFRKPMIVMTPKSLLRHPHAVSRLAELSSGGFQEVIDDSAFVSNDKAAKVSKILLCSGKVYYDLIAERTLRKREDVAIVRVEQIYPWPAKRLSYILSQYPSANITWVQEEPRNMGPWNFVFGTWMGGLADFREMTGRRPIGYAGREIGAAPAAGSSKIHSQEQQALIEKAYET